ncbi:MAG: Flp pilus assembly protein CpaB [Rhodospirillaceae bacterium]|nr:Flp pilus assembly protein CpaB [Rhodospirillaceae bacterium]
MRTIIIGLIFAAVVLVGGTAYLLKNYLSTQEASIAALAPKEFAASILVANVDMPAGTVINASNVTWQAWPEDGVSDEYIVEESGKDPVSDLEKVKHVVRYAISKGEPILKRKLHTPENASFMPGTIKPGMRAVAINVNQLSASGGFVLPGDRVDVVLVNNLLKQLLVERSGGGELPLISTVTEVIMEDVLVLAVNGQVSEFQNGTTPIAIVLLEVTPKGAEKLITAQRMGTLSLLVRPLEGVNEYPAGQGPGYTTDIEVSPTLSKPDAVLAGKRIKEEPKKAPAKPATAPANTNSSGRIKVFE